MLSLADGWPGVDPVKRMQRDNAHGQETTGSVISSAAAEGRRSY